MMPGEPFPGTRYNYLLVKESPPFFTLSERLSSLIIAFRPSKRNTDTRNMTSSTKKPLRQRAGALFQTRPRVDNDTPVQQRSSRRLYADHTYPGLRA